jgi:hypothetical protein
MVNRTSHSPAAPICVTGLGHVITRNTAHDAGRSIIVHRGMVEGKITYRSYENKEGVKKYVTEIVIDQLVMLDGKKSDSEHAEPVAAGAPQAKDGDLPF